MAIVAFLFRIATVVDAYLLVRVVQLPVLVLILFIEIDDEEWVLKVDEEVSHVCVLLWLFLIGDDIKIAVSVFVRPVDLFLKLLFVIAARDVFDAKIGT